MSRESPWRTKLIVSAAVGVTRHFLAMDDVRGALSMLEMEGFARLAEDGWHRVVRR